MLNSEDKKAAWELAKEDGRIVPWAKYGQHIMVTCKNHDDLRWHTKNISCIGMRTVFFQDPYEKEECDCSVNDMIPVEPEDWDIA